MKINKTLETGNINHLFAISHKQSDDLFKLGKVFVTAKAFEKVNNG